MDVDVDNQVESELKLVVVADIIDRLKEIRAGKRGWNEKLEEVVRGVLDGMKIPNVEVHNIEQVLEILETVAGADISEIKEGDWKREIVSEGKAIDPNKLEILVAEYELSVAGGEKRESAAARFRRESGGMDVDRIVARKREIFEKTARELEAKGVGPLAADEVARNLAVEEEFLRKSLVEIHQMERERAEIVAKTITEVGVDEIVENHLESEGTSRLERAEIRAEKAVRAIDRKIAPEIVEEVVGVCRRTVVENSATVHANAIAIKMVEDLKGNGIVAEGAEREAELIEAIQDRVVRVISGELESLETVEMAVGTKPGVSVRNDLMPRVVEITGRRESSEIQIIKQATKKASEAVGQYQAQQPEIVAEFQAERLRGKIGEELRLLSPKLEQGVVDRYVEVVVELSKTNPSIGPYREEVVGEYLARNPESSRSRAEGSWRQLNILTNLMKGPRKVEETLNKYREAVAGLEKLGGKLPFGVKECLAVDGVIKTITTNSGLIKMAGVAQKVLGIYDGFNNLGGTILVKIGARLGLKEAGLALIGRIGGQGAAVMATNAFNLIMAQGLNAATLSTIFGGLISGGVGAGAATGGAAAVAGGAAVTGVATAGIGAVVILAATVAYNLVVKPVIGVLKKVGRKLQDWGLDLGLGDTIGGGLGKMGGLALGAAVFLVGLPRLLVTAIATIPIIPAIVAVVGAVTVMQIMSGNQASVMVQPGLGGEEGGNQTVIFSGTLPEGCPQRMWPTMGTITQGPGGSYSHRGTIRESIDIANNQGTEILSTIKGVALVRRNPGKSGYGLHVVVAATCNGVPYQAVFGHMIEVAAKFRNGDGNLIGGQVEVDEGELIGQMDSTGNSTGSHLHYGIINNGLVLNDYLPKFVGPCSDNCNMTTY